MTRITGNLHEDQYKFLIIYLAIIVIMRKYADDICRENQNTRFISGEYLQSLSQGVWSKGIYED